MSTIPLPRNRALDGRYTDMSSYPATEEGWADCYDRRWACYIGEKYDTSEIKAFHLFRALDENNEEVDHTRRIFNLTKFIVDTDVWGALGGGVALEVRDGIAEGDDARRVLLAAGEAVWARSLIDERLEGWVRSTAVLADFYVEAVRTSAAKPYRTTLVGYDARNVTPYYDQETGTRLIKVVIDAPYIDEDTVGANGVIQAGALHTYRREIDAFTVKVYVNGKLIEELPHSAGVIPVVHLQWAPFTSPEHGLPAASGVDQLVMSIDSAATQGKAISTRFANPIGYITGAKVAEGADLMQFGRWVTGLPADGKLGYLEPSGNMVRELQEQIRSYLDYLQDTEPEFLFADAGVNVSAEAKAFKAAAFENKIGAARKRIFAALSRVTAIAVAMDAGRPVDVERIPFRIDAGPVLPRNVKSEIDTLNAVRDRITPADYVRHLQRLGIVGLHEDPEEYAAKVTARAKPAPTVTPPKVDPPAGDEPADEGEGDGA